MIMTKMIHITENYTSLLDYDDEGRHMDGPEAFGGRVSQSSAERGGNDRSGLERG